MPLLWRLIQVCTPPPPPHLHPRVHILRVDTVRLFLKLPDHTFSWRLPQPPGSSRNGLEVSERAVPLPATHNHTHAHTHAHVNEAPRLFMSRLTLTCGALGCVTSCHHTQRCHESLYKLRKRILFFLTKMSSLLQFDDVERATN